jgi:pimeloyl-ACP methyl ester carboxylesterase
MPPGLRTVASMAGALLLSTFGVGSPAAFATASAPPTRPAATGALAWTPCGDGFECAKLAVPRNWTDRSGEKIELALSRLPTTAMGHRRIGSLLVNFGGPGDPGVSSLRQSGPLIRAATRGRFDVVSWDPRGLGQSTPILCPEGNDAFYNADPATPEGLAAMAAAATLRAQACLARYGSFLGEIGTNQVVQDMDAIRRAVGDDKVTFLGMSYGSRVGSVYAQFFPRRVRAMVLDGSMPPVSTLQEVSETLASSFERALHDWLDRCAGRPPCAFGPDPLAAFDALYDRVRREQPIVPSAGGRRFTVGLLNQVILVGLVNKDNSTELVESAIASYMATGDFAGLMALAEAIIGRQPDGSYRLPDGSLRNEIEIFQFVNCLDWPDRPTPEQVAALVETVKPAAPRLGPFGVAYAYVNSVGCPVAATPVPPPSHVALPPILVVGNNDDPETPLVWSQELSMALPRSRLLVSQSFGHTAFLTSPCVAQRAGDYLVGLRPPPIGTVCPDPDLGRSPFSAFPRVGVAGGS